ncbi:MAG TPA: AarF/UbiB family protein [Polyangiales bacterium]
MSLAVRLLRALHVAARIFASYALQGALVRLLQRELPASDREGPRHKLPAWLKRRGLGLHERNAERLLHSILRLQGVYVKLGQVLSIMGGFLPSAFRKKLETLQDAVPPRPFAQMQAQFVESLGRPTSECFAHIESTPIAAASLGQVHVAYLHDGRKVAVKILYPGIRELVRLDLRLLRWALRAYQRYLPVGNLEVVHTSLVDLLRRETDYVHEAQCMRRFADNFKDRPYVLCPEVIAELSTREVLTMTFMEGIKVSHVATLAQQGIAVEVVAQRLLECFFEQLFVHRFFHADPHPGNFLVRKGESAEDPLLVVLDFGAVSEAREDLVEGLVDVLVAYFGRDGQALLRGFTRMGFAAGGGDQTLLEETVLMYFERLLTVKQRTPAALMRARTGELRKLVDPNMELHRVRELARAFTYPEGWFYIERALVMTFWLCGEIYPEIDMLGAAFPYVMPKLAARQLQSERVKQSESVT